VQDYGAFEFVVDTMDVRTVERFTKRSRSFPLAAGSSSGAPIEHRAPVDVQSG